MTTAGKVATRVLAGALLLCASGCEDDDAELSQTKVSGTQAAMVVQTLMPRVLDFSDEARRLAQAALATGAAAPVAGPPTTTECSLVPGVESEYLCSVPQTGVSCPVRTSISEWRFVLCRDGDRTLDGTAGVEVRRSTTDSVLFDFDLAVEGTHASGVLSVDLGPCGSYDYSPQFTLKAGSVSATLHGEIGCGAFLSSQVEATITASGFLPFSAILTVDGGAVLINQNARPEFVCSYYTSSRTAVCEPVEPTSGS